MEDNEDLLRVKEILTNLFHDGISEKLETMLGNLEKVDILYRLGDWHEISGVVKLLRKDIKILQFKMYN